MKHFLIADDHYVVQVGLKALLQQQYPGCKIDTVSDGNQLVTFMKTYSPDLVVMDVTMPNSAGLSTLRLMLTYRPEAKVLVYSAHPVGLYALPFLRAGAAGYVSKDMEMRELLTAVDAVVRTGRYMNPLLREQLANDFFDHSKGNSFRKLSSREFEIAMLLCGGHSSQQICQTLNLHKTTVSTFKRRIFEKLSVTSVPELSQLARLLEMPLSSDFPDIPTSTTSDTENA